MCAAFGLAWCWLGGALGWLGAGFGVAVACVVIPCLRSYACWAGLGSVGGIATIGAALRRVVGVSGVYGRKIPRGCLEGPASRALSVAVLVVFDMSLCVCRGGVACFCWWLGGNCYHRRCVAACRRRVGGLWSQNPPSAWSEGPASRARGGVYGRKTPRVLAQSADHLGGMRVTWGVWGVVDDGLGVVAWGEAFSVGRRVGYVGSQCVLPG